MTAAEDGVDFATSYINLGAVDIGCVTAAVDVFGAAVAFLHQHFSTTLHSGSIATAVHIAVDGSHIAFMT